MPVLTAVVLKTEKYITQELRPNNVLLRFGLKVGVARTGKCIFLLPPPPPLIEWGKNSAQGRKLKKKGRKNEEK